MTDEMLNGVRTCKTTVLVVFSIFVPPPSLLFSLLLPYLSPILHHLYCCQGFTENQLQAVESISVEIEEREKEIRSIVQSISEINEMYRDLATLIVDQVEPRLVSLNFLPPSLFIFFSLCIYFFPPHMHMHTHAHTHTCTGHHTGQNRLQCGASLVQSCKRCPTTRESRETSEEIY